VVGRPLLCGRLAVPCFRYSLVNFLFDCSFHSSNKEFWCKILLMVAEVCIGQKKFDHLHNHVKM
jgi:hypothetical protein